MYKLEELEGFLNDIKKYHLLILKYQSGKLTSKQKIEAIKLQGLIQRKVGRHQELIKELSGRACKVTTLIKGKEIVSDMWLGGLKLPIDEDSLYFLNVCIDITTQAIGKLEDDINKGVRDKATGERTEKPHEFVSEPPKAFIAHGGESPSLNKLKKFLEALGVKPLVVEEQASEDRSVGENVDWYSKKADCAIILATKGDIDGKTGDFIPRGNVLMEIGKLQQLFKGRIIYLLQANTRFPTNVSEKVWARFSPQSMDNAFIKVARELKAFGILKSVKP